MTKIVINDLECHQEISKKELANVMGGLDAFSYAIHSAYNTFPYEAGWGSEYLYNNSWVPGYYYDQYYGYYNYYAW